MRKEDIDALIATGSVAGGLGLFAGITRAIIEQKHGSIGGFARTVIASVLVGILVGFALEGVSLVVAVKAGIIVAVAVVADDALAALRACSQMFGADPLGFVGRLWRAIRGQPSEK